MIARCWPEEVQQPTGAEQFRAEHHGEANGQAHRGNEDCHPAGRDAEEARHSRAGRNEVRVQRAGDAAHARDDPGPRDQDLAARYGGDPPGGDGPDAVPVGPLEQRRDVPLAPGDEDVVGIGPEDGLAAHLRETRAVAEDVAATAVAQDVVGVGAGPDRTGNRRGRPRRSRSRPAWVAATRSGSARAASSSSIVRVSARASSLAADRAARPGRNWPGSAASVGCSRTSTGMPARRIGRNSWAAACRAGVRMTRSAPSRAMMSGLKPMRLPMRGRSSTAGG